MPKKTTTTEIINPPATSGGIIISEKTVGGDNTYLQPTSSGQAAIMPTEGRSFTWGFWGNFTTPVSRSAITWLTCYTSGPTKKLTITYQHGISTRMHVYFGDGSSGQRQLKKDLFGAMHLDAWHHFVFTWNGETNNLVDNFKLYLDGVLVPLSAVTGAASNLADMSGGEMVFFSADRSGISTSTGNPENAQIDEMVWFEAAFTEAEVVQLYNNGKTFNPLTRHSQRANIKGWWTFDTDKLTVVENAVTASDSSGNAYTMFNHSHGFGGPGNKSFNSGSAYPFADDEIQTDLYFSGIMSDGVRRQIRRMDNRNGMYPPTKRLGDRARTGDTPVYPFDDEDTIVFEKISNLVFGSLTRDGTGRSEDPYVGANQLFNPISGNGSLISGITDHSQMESYKTLAAEKSYLGLPAGEDFITASVLFSDIYDDSRINLAPTDYYLTGTSEQVYPGFSSRLYDKTQIIIPLNTQRNPLGESKFGLITKGNNSNTALDSSNAKQKLMAYYNRDLGKWQGIAQGYNANVTTKTSASLRDMIDKAAIGFSGLPSNNAVATGSGAATDDYRLYDETILNSTFRPISTFGFPFHGKYHATGSQVFSMKSYINSPFLVEKIVYEFDVEIACPAINQDNYGSYQLRRTYTDSSNNPSQKAAISSVIKSYNFFLLRQFKDSKTTNWTVLSGSTISTARANAFNDTHTFPPNDIPLSQYSSSIPGHFFLSDGGTQTLVDTNREMISYGQLIEHDIDENFIGSFANSKITKNDVLSSSLMSGRDSVLDRTGSLRGANVFTASIRIESDCRHTSALLPITSIDANLENQQVVYLSNDFSSRGDDRLEKSSRALFGGHQSLKPNKSVTHLAARTASTVPDILTGSDPESIDSPSPYILYPEDNIIVGFQFPLSNRLINSAPSSDDTTFHSLNFNGPGRVILFGSQIRNKIEFHDTLNQTLTSEAVHESIHYDNPTVDQFLLGTRSDYSGTYSDNHAKGRGKGRVATNVESLIGSSDNTLSGSFQRFVNLSDTRRRYFDSMMPSIVQMAKIDGVESVELGGGTGYRYINTITGSIPGDANPNATHKFWDFIFPFESRYSKLNRVIDEKAFVLYKNKEHIQVHSHEATPYVALGTVVGHDGPNPPGGYASWSRDSRFMAFGFGSGPSGSFRELELRRSEHPRGFKYGVINALPLHARSVFRSDRYGQCADMLEQGKDTRYYFSDKNVVTNGPIRIRFLQDDEENDQYIVLNPEEIGGNTFESSNISIFATSSLPFFDTTEITKNRKFLTSSLIVVPIL